jgi:hypothetical protein
MSYEHDSRRAAHPRTDRVKVDDAAGIENEDPVEEDDGPQAMRNDEERRIRELLRQRLADELVRLVIDIAVARQRASRTGIRALTMSLRRAGRLQQISSPLDG